MIGAGVKKWAEDDKNFLQWIFNVAVKCCLGGQIYISISDERGELVVGSCGSNRIK